MDINNDDKSISAVTCTRFLGLTVNCSLTWTNHIDLLTKKLGSTCFLIHNIKPYLSLSALKMIYYSLFHSVMSYGTIFWGNSPHSPVIFKMQKRVIRILIGICYRESCRGLIKDLNILLLHRSIFSPCYCLLFLIGVTLPRIVFIITLTPDKRITCISLVYP
jgi:hypothetical protein